MAALFVASRITHNSCIPSMSDDVPRATYLILITSSIFIIISVLLLVLVIRIPILIGIITVG